MPASNDGPRPPKGRLELTWVGKESRPRLEPRVLVEDPKLSYGDPRSANILIHGDNLLALKALEQDFAGRIKCIYIDPPFNTGQAMEHYDDGLEHSIWLSLMADRLRILRELLTPDGTLFAHIDDNELGYLMVLLDEIFGRSNRLFVVTFKQGSATGHKAINPGCVNTSNFVLMYARERANWAPNRVFTARGRDPRYNLFIENKQDDFRKWRFRTLIRAYARASGSSERDARRAIKRSPDLIDQFVIEHAESVVQMARPNYEGVGAATRQLIDESKRRPDDILRLERDGYSDILLKGGMRILFYSDKLKVIDGRRVAGEPLTTIWDDVLSNNLHKEGGVEFPKGKKPEALVQRILDLSTQPGDWVLDSFAGSGTTGAVAHKMGRRWIMVELRDHCYTHIIPRLKRVITGQDQDGTSKAVGWTGGGGFKLLKLAETLLVRDKDLSTAKKPVYIINPKYDAKMLIRAICKIENFRYLRDNHWHGASSEHHFLYVTTSLLSQRHLDSVSAQLGEEEALLVYCTRRASRLKVPDYIEVKKIPRDLLAKCSFEESLV
jgi:adenine-specific DNA-methyltransferase